MERPLALVVDGDPAIRAQVREVLEKRGIDTLDASRREQALELVRAHPVALLFADLASVGARDADLARDATHLRPTIVPVVLTSPQDSVAALAMVGHGAFDVLDKPLSEERLNAVAGRALAQHALMEELLRLRGEATRAREQAPQLVGRSPALERIRSQIERLAASSAPVLFVGESGTGKTLAARVLHAASLRRGGPFVKLDCKLEISGGGDGGGQGAFQGTQLHDARGGAVLLQGVTELLPQIQDELMRRLETSGAGESLDARILFSTEQDPERAVHDGRLRPGLLRKLAGARIEIPPLRERPEDVLPLTQHFLDALRRMNDLGSISLAPDTVSLLERYSWPGNVRELRLAIEQALIVATEGVVRPQHLPETLRGQARRESHLERSHDQEAGRFRERKREVVEAFERAYLRDLLARKSGNVTVAAQHAGMLRSALQRLLRKYDLRSADFRRGRRRQDAAERP